MPRDRTGIDPRAPRFGQALTGTLTLGAFLLDAPWLVAALALLLGAGATFGSRANLWAQLYKRLVQPFLAPPEELEHPAPPRFAMCLGFVFTSAGALVLLPLAGYVAAWIGWTLVLIVSALALFAAATDVCVGCRLYALVARGRTQTSQEAGA